MRSKISWSKVPSLIRQYLNNPAKAGLFFSMILWSLAIRILLIFLPVEKLLRWVLPKERQLTMPKDEILRYLYWLKKLRIINKGGDCLALALLYHRYLMLAGEEPVLYIGFHDSTGHAWVEILGQVVSEPPDDSQKYVPTLLLPAGNKKFIPVK